MESASEFSRSFKVSKFRVTLSCTLVAGKPGPVLSLLENRVLYSRCWKTGSCTLVAGKPVNVESIWYPYHPGGPTGKAYRQYRRKRDACISALAEQLRALCLRSSKVDCLQHFQSDK